MLHAARPPPHPWPVMSHPGHELLQHSGALHHQVHTGLPSPHYPAHPGATLARNGLSGAHPMGQGGQGADLVLGHQTHLGHHGLPPNSTPGFGNSATSNSFYNPGLVGSHHSGFIFPPTSYTVHHPALRPSSRELPDQGAGTGAETQANSGDVGRHPSGGSMTGGSVGSHTPPSPAEEGRTGPYKQNSVIMDRNSSIRNSFEQRQTHGETPNNNNGSQQQGSPAQSGGNGSGPHTPYRMQPPSPATSVTTGVAAVSSHVPQKSPFDMTTMGMNKAKSGMDYTQSSVAGQSAPSRSAFRSSSGRPDSVISSAPRMPSSPYQSSVAIKQEPGSPAHYASNLVSRAVKQEPNQPNSPRNINATPPPSTTQKSHGFSSVNSMDNKKHPLNRQPSQQGGGFNFPSPQPHGGSGTTGGGSGSNSSSSASNPISPSAVNLGGDVNIPAASKFRYPSGPQPVQNHSPGESTSNSALSSREGTPGPGPRHSWCGEEQPAPAPNVDISNVQVKEEFGVPLMRYATANSTDDYSRRPSINLSYPAGGVPSTVVSSHMDTSGYHGYGSYHPSMPQQVALPPRGLHHPGMRPGSVHPGHSFTGSGIPGRPLSLPGNSESPASHSNVKIGRRPAHLPKVLKFSDTTLPHGWIRKLKQRKHGKQAGRWDVYIYSPCGVKFASRKKLRNFFEKNNLQYDPEDFDFTPYGRHIEQSSHTRHHSSGEGGGRHGGPGSGGSPSSVPSPSGSFAGPGGGIHSEYKTEFLSPPTPNPPTAHRPLTFGHPSHQPLFSDYNPMMESPPNANALEVPQHQILNLSQTQPIPNSSLTRGSSTPIPPSSHPVPASNFPPDIATILNEPSDNGFRQSLREYSDLSSRGNHTVGPTGSEGHVGHHPEDHQMHVDSEGGDGEKKDLVGSEDTQFMTRTYNLLTASQGDLGDMMDEYIYPQ